MSIDYLRSLVNEYQDELFEWQDTGNKVIEQYGKIFHPNSLQVLTKAEFHSFLLYKNNQHWDGIHRQSGFLTEDMSHLRNVLSILLDNSQPLDVRLDKIFPKGKNKMIKGLGRAVATPILQVVYPDKFGVFNSKCESALQFLNLYPSLERGATFAEQYIEVNNLLLQLAKDLDVTLWQLDVLWHLVLLRESGVVDEDDEEANQSLIDIDSVDDLNTLIRFSLEQHLADFLYRNWDKTDLGKEYDLYDEGGETAKEYSTSIGRIDLLASFWCKSVLCGKDGSC